LACIMPPFCFRTQCETWVVGHYTRVVRGQLCYLCYTSFSKNLWRGGAFYKGGRYTV